MPSSMDVLKLEMNMIEGLDVIQLALNNILHNPGPRFYKRHKVLNNLATFWQKILIFEDDL